MSNTSLWVILLILKAIVFYDPIAKKLIISRDALFDEKNAWIWDEKQGGPVFVHMEETNVEEIGGDLNSSSSTATNSSGSTNDESSSGSSTPPRKWGSLLEIYQRTKRCQLAYI